MEKIFTHLKKVSLTTAEKASIRQALLTGLDYQPARLRPWFIVPFASVLMMGLVLMLAASGSLPGDNLYAFKTGIKEPVARFFHYGSLAAKIKFESSLVENRLREAEALLAEKRLVGDLKDKVKQAVVKQTALAESVEPDESKNEVVRILKQHESIVSELEIKN